MLWLVRNSAGQDFVLLSDGALLDDVCGVQIHTQLKLVPEVLHAYTYSIGSLLTAAALGVLVYGSMVWST